MSDTCATALSAKDCIKTCQETAPSCRHKIKSRQLGPPVQGLLKCPGKSQAFVITGHAAQCYAATAMVYLAHCVVVVAC